MIRFAAEADLPAFAGIERAAGELFRPLGMDLVADDDPFSMAELLPYQRAGRAWVAEPDGVVAGYLLADPVDGCAHVEQVSVHPRFARRGIGAALIGALDGWAAKGELPALTLTTFRDVPWNGPYYRRLGFRWLAENEITPGLRAVRGHEAAHGLDRWPRGCMRREVVGTRPAATDE